MERDVDDTAEIRLWATGLKVVWKSNAETGRIGDSKPKIKQNSNINNPINKMDSKGKTGRKGKPTSTCTVEEDSHIRVGASGDGF